MPRRGPGWTRWPFKPEQRDRHSYAVRMIFRRKPKHPDWWGQPYEPVPYVLQLPPPPPPMLWRHAPGGSEAVLLPLGFLQRLARPERLLQISGDRERLDELRGDMGRAGIRRPLVLVMDDQGRITMLDGHHRIIVAGEIGLNELPVILERSDGIRVAHCSVVDLFGDILMLLKRNG